MNEKYAIVVTDSGYIPGSNGILNALKYYNTDIEFHYLYCPTKSVLKFVNSVIDSKQFPNFIPININDLINAPNFIIKNDANTPWLCKFLRYQYIALKLQDYAAVVMYDADVLIVNDITPYLEVAAKTKKIVLPNNDYSNAEYDLENHITYRGAASPPFHCWPLFLNPSTYHDLLMEVPKYSINGIGSDMVSLNNAIIDMNHLQNVLVLPGFMWVFSHYNFIKLYKRRISNKNFIAVHKGGDRIYSIHRRWWHEKVCEKYIVGPKTQIERDNAKNNIKIFWDFYRFFNLECYHNIEWDQSFGGFPNV